MQTKYPCHKCNMDDGSPLCLRDDRCPVPPIEVRLAPTDDPVTDVEIEIAFLGTNFGRTDYRHFLGLSVLKTALRYHCGHTITQIMVKMGLTTNKGRVTERGRLFCYQQMDLRNSG